MDVHDTIDSWEYLINNKMINNKAKGIINDLSNCELTMNMEGFKILMAYLKKQDCFKNIKLAVVTDSPQTIVFPALGEQKESDLHSRPFTTLQVAVDWVTMDV